MYFVALSYFLLLFVVESLQTSARFEYKYGFKAPHITNTDNTIPFWTYGGHAIASNEQVRVAPSLKSRKGWLWAKNPLPFKDWIVDVVMRIHGRGKVGADGMVFWVTTDREQEGPIFGSKDMWNGLGVFFDSFDNDGRGNNPAIYAVMNDGRQTFDHNNDGGAQIIGSCLRDFRNKPYPYRVRVEYYRNTLTVSVSTGMQANEEASEMCLRVENVNIPQNAYLGLSSATGGLADDHDVLALITHSLHDSPLADPAKIAAERERLDKQYREYYEQLEQSKKDYAQQNPNAKAPDSMIPQEYFEAPQDRELRQIFEGQSIINSVLTQMSAKLDEIIGRQHNTLSAISAKGGAPPVQGGQQPPAIGGGSQELVQLLNENRQLVNTVREMRQAIADVQNRVQTLGNQNAQIGGSAGSGGDIYQLRNSLNEIKVDTQNLLRSAHLDAASAVKGCPSCLGTWLFVGFIVVQTVILVGLQVFKKSSDTKKLY